MRWSPSILFLFLLSLGGMPFAKAADSCEAQKDHFLFFFREGIGKTRQRLVEVEGAAALSPSTKSEFRQEAEWLVAWLEDQSERIESLKECATLPSLARDALLQLRPVETLSQKIQASLIIWELDKLSQDAEMTEEGRLLIAEARAQFHLVTLGLEDHRAARIALRVGAFKVRNLLRFLRVRAILI